MSPESCSESEQQLCLPTHQLFDFPEASPSPSGLSPSPPSPKPQRLSISINPNSASHGSSKRSASPAPNVTKKARASGERISSKDFVPPDVSGLSKREARLVKNRAAAFLSRQRKREEFECMEIRVTELEQENARLLGLTQNGKGNISAKADAALASEVEKLRAQLAAAEERERELSAELAEKAAAQEAPVKVEAIEPQFSASPTRPLIQSPHKSGASLGLMVLLCALPTLLSMPAQSSLPTSFSFPGSALTASSSTFDLNSFLPNEYDWSRSAGGNPMMDLDIDDQGRISTGAPSTTANTRKLEFVDGDSGLSSLDISFDASPSENGKIRVRIHPTTSASSSGSSSPSLSYPTKLDSSSLAMWAGSDSGFDSSFSESFPGAGLGGDPFLGVGASSDFSHYTSDGSTIFSQAGSSVDFSSLQSSGASFGFGSEFDNTSTSRRRVRIALKSMPMAGGEGGEWEVQFC
jgi:hypothetical protein